MATPRICSIDRCGKPSATRGFCRAHYARWQRYGDPLGGPHAMKGEPLRWLREIACHHDEDVCLAWPFAISVQGYGVRIRHGEARIFPHVFVCTQRHGPRPPGLTQAAHSCGNRACCAPKHLRWATFSENELDKRLHGTDNRGERHYNAKLTDEDVARMREIGGHMTKAEIAKAFGVSRSLASMIINRKRRAAAE